MLFSELVIGLEHVKNLLREGLLQLIRCGCTDVIDCRTGLDYVRSGVSHPLVTGFVERGQVVVGHREGKRLLLSGLQQAGLAEIFQLQCRFFNLSLGRSYIQLYNLLACYVARIDDGYLCGKALA